MTQTTTGLDATSSHRCISAGKSIALALAAMLFMAALPGPAMADGYKYIVQEGDTLLDIAIQHNADIETLMNLNGLTGSDYLSIGQELIVPVGGAAPTAMPARTAATANPTPTLPPPTTRTPTSRAPGTPVVPGGASVYVIQEGDTLVSIATQLNTTWQHLASLNRMSNPGEIRIGQKLIVPGGKQQGAAADLVLSWPAVGSVSTYYGEKAEYYYSGTHSGIDIAAKQGAPVRAAGAGTVTLVQKRTDEYGWHIVITHSKSYSTLYAHLSRIDVKEGDKVGAGQVIGAVGDTGFSIGPHLHFEVRRDGQWINPLQFLP